MRREKIFKVIITLIIGVVLLLTKFKIPAEIAAMINNTKPKCMNSFI